MEHISLKLSGKTETPNVVLFRVPGRKKKQIPKERQQDDLSFFAEFCQKGLQCEEVTVKSAIRLGESNANVQTIKQSRFLKLFLEDEEQKAKIVAALKHLKIVIKA